MADVVRKDSWTPEEDQMVIDLRAKRISWNDVASQIGRSVHACCDRYRRIAPKDGRSRYMSQNRWSEHDETTMARMLEEKKTPKEIAAALGRTVSMIHSKIYYERCHIGRIRLENVSRVFVPPERAADRDRRLTAERDITSMFFGDPAPGQSALDKKQGAYA